MHHGPILVVLEAAALKITEAQAEERGVTPTALSCRIVRAGRKGPFKVSSRLLSRNGDLITCRSVMRDEGREYDIIAIMMWQARITTGRHEL